jgi:hypothetical protein
MDFVMFGVPRIVTPKAGLRRGRSRSVASPAFEDRHPAVVLAVLVPHGRTPAMVVPVGYTARP